VLTAIEVRNAAGELVRFGHAIRSLGLGSWSIGVGFAAAAVGLRFLNGKDMAAPEFVSCIVFASLLVLSGIVLYILESRGYLKLVSEIAVRDKAAHGDPESADGRGGKAHSQ
jgi:hypothetical protein